ncbi:stage II sporulation protein R [Weizmannia acidilactici]|uniref:Stage II sporulation protein R n=1 Tax=Weizmannia acidilactici TaxID=2607726 RepID=A0A5J4J3E6_9BACI|nr:stage II sporulation protein R [Weizmannia acidilactici]GER66368.1 stage II sporulation protein R [Weizmannia acidilactici]GER69486.1 stage II sporulation protein R [Weizmannia acidilactici]GER73023.1 stage II sporulation protein R [Weizmannia acidilactici]
MRRKTIVSLYIVMLSIATILSLYAPKQKAAATDTVVIPKDAIRLRILANSDKPEDQAVKRKIRDEVNAEITKWVGNLTSKDEAEKVIRSHLPDIERIAKRVIAEERMNQSVKVELGKVAFPTKLYGQYLYPAGKYEAVLITLGKGQGANWWCVLYPPLCFLDFPNGVAVEGGFEEKPKETGKNTKVAEPAAHAEKPAGDTAVKKTKTAKSGNEAAPEKTDNHEDKKSVRKETKHEGRSGQSVYMSENDEVKKKLLVVEIIKKLF